MEGSRGMDLDCGGPGGDWYPLDPIPIAVVIPGGGPGTCESHVRETAGVIPEGKLMAWPLLSLTCSLPLTLNAAVPFLPIAGQHPGSRRIRQAPALRSLLTTGSSLHFAFFFCPCITASCINTVLITILQRDSWDWGQCRGYNCPWEGQQALGSSGRHLWEDMKQHKIVNKPPREGEMTVADRKQKGNANTRGRRPLDGRAL